jgi:hypothetical protein
MRDFCRGRKEVQGKQKVVYCVVIANVWLAIGRKMYKVVSTEKEF